MPQPRVCVQSLGVAFAAVAAYLCWTRLVQRQAGSKPGAGADVGHWKIQGRCMILMAQAPATGKILPSYSTPRRGLEHPAKFYPTLRHAVVVWL